MSQKIVDETTGEEVEVYTAAEVDAARTEGATAKENEYKPKLSELETELTGARKALGERANEFAQFRKLSEEQVLQLTEKDRIIYENGLALENERQKRTEAEENNRKAQVASIIKTKSNGSADLEKKMTEMWDVIGVDATTPDTMEVKANMVLGAISTTTPDLLASINGFQGGTYQPPQASTGDDKSFGETDKGKAAAAELGLVIEPPKAA